MHDSELPCSRASHHGLRLLRALAHKPPQGINLALHSSNLQATPLVCIPQLRGLHPQLPTLPTGRLNQAERSAKLSERLCLLQHDAPQGANIMPHLAHAAQGEGAALLQWLIQALNTAAKVILPHPQCLARQDRVLCSSQEARNRPVRLLLLRTQVVLPPDSQGGKAANLSFHPRELLNTCLMSPGMQQKPQLKTLQHVEWRATAVLGLLQAHRLMAPATPRH
mmetsp:Transcript_12819/g.36407  ORF Transcript_12819/g.36407 Transcript_12819/m.36407 type:complete len:223 (+) Transcript_12819:198-866(+)